MKIILSHRHRIGLVGLAIGLTSAACFALVMVESKGNWPASWPQELEALRSRATTFHVANGQQECIYAIPFTNRAEFEKLWPALLTLKSKNAPITLEPSPQTNYVAGSTMPTGVCIFAPPDRPSPLPAGVRSALGELPEYFTNSGVMERVRTDFVLITDGQVIDLGRIKLPAGTAIIDNRPKK